MKKFILLGIFVLSFVFMQNSVFSQESNIYTTAYLVRLQNKVRTNWVVPHGEPDKLTVVSLEIDENGNLTKSFVSKSSGDNQFDELALSAIINSAPFGHFSQNSGEDSIKANFTFNQNCFEAVQVLDNFNANNVVQNTSKANPSASNIQDAGWKSNTAQINEDDDTNSKDVDFKPYMKNLQKQIKHNWSPPSQKSSKKTVALFKIKKDGTLSGLKILNSSGNEKYDQRALEAIKKTAPFLPLPEDFNGKSIDIQFTFDYNVFPTNSRSAQEDNDISSRNDYKRVVEAIISSSLPKGFYFKNKCLVLRLKIRNDGYLESVKVVHSSRNIFFDTKYTNAVRACSFPSFPDTLNAQYLSIDYVVQVNKSEGLYQNNCWGSFWLVWSTILLSHAIWH